MINNICLAVIIIIEIIIAYKIIKKTYRYYQQSHYHLSSAFLYIKKHYLNTKSTYLLYPVLIISFFYFLYTKIVIIVFLIALLILIFKEKEIIPLKITSRIKRLFAINIIIIIMLLSLSFSLENMSTIILFALPIITLVSFIISIPLEKMISKSYLRKAKKRIKDEETEIIAITGSFGKTTTKNFVYEFIKNKYMTTMSPSSFNTLNGLSITINNQAIKSEKLVLEYGASHKNDIKKLVSFIKPKYAIVTGIGEQHLSSFKNLDNIIKEKMLLIESLEEDDVGVINIDDENISSYPINTKAKIIKVGQSEKADYMAYDIKYNEEGLNFKVRSQGKTFNIETRLLGRHNITNILCALALSDYLGVEQHIIEREAYFLKNISHRLEVTNENNYIIIDDSFNSNYHGFLNALEVLSFYNEERILITPGIVEAGKKEEEINKAVSEKIVSVCSRVYLVSSNSSKHIKNYFLENNYTCFKEVYSTKEAFHYLVEDVKRGVVLIENDISDFYK